jgi:RNA polymerase sigma factor (TIGR02999 family)
VGERTDITLLLNRARGGDPSATNELIPLVYDELRALADQHLQAERPGHTLQPTALAHEAYLRLVGSAESEWENRAHFFGAAAAAIRRILVDHARRAGRLKRGGGRRPLALDDLPEVADQPEGPDILAVHEALLELADLDPGKARLVELRFFGGLTVDEAAAVLGVSPRTTARDWQFARAWLKRALEEARDGS